MRPVDGVLRITGGVLPWPELRSLSVSVLWSDAVVIRQLTGLTRLDLRRTIDSTASNGEHSCCSAGLTPLTSLCELSLREVSLGDIKDRDVSLERAIGGM